MLAFSPLGLYGSAITCTLGVQYVPASCPHVFSYGLSARPFALAPLASPRLVRRCSRLHTPWLAPMACFWTSSSHC